MLCTAVAGAGASGFEEQETHVRGSSAFDSPDTLAGFVDYLRTTGEKLQANAWVAIVPRSTVGYPQTWQRPGWTLGNGEGFFCQLEASSRDGQSQRLLWFVPTKLQENFIGMPSLIDASKFGVLPPLLR